MTAPTDEGPDLVLIALSLTAALLSSLFLHDAAFVLAGGAYDYPSVAPYLHLAAAERIAGGLLAELPGPALEVMTRAPLFTLSLAPLTEFGWADHAPLLLNAVGLLLAAYLWGLVLWQGGLGGTALGLLLALAGPVALYFPGLAFGGTEQGLALAASLAVISGLLRFLEQKTASVALGLGVVLAPLLRVDGVFLALEAGLVVLALGRVALGLSLIAAATLPLGLVFAALQFSGIDLMQVAWISDVLAKRLTDLPTAAVGSEAGQTLAVMIAVGAVVFLLSSKRRLLLLPALFAGVAALLLGEVGGLQAPEAVALATLCAALFAATEPSRWLRLVALVPFCFAAYIYLPLQVNLLPPQPKVQQLGPGQVGRLAADHLAGRVTTDALGQHLWRLGVGDWQPAALASGSVPAEVPEDVMLIAQQSGGAAPGWARLGVLQSPGGPIQLFARAAEREDLGLMLIDWVADLPNGASFVAEGAPIPGQ